MTFLENPRRRFTFRKILAGLQVGGAVFGILFIAVDLIYASWPSGPQVNVLFSLPVVILLLLLGFSILAGVWLWQDKLRGYWTSAIVQCLQIPIVMNYHFLWTYILGFGIALRYQWAIGEFTNTTINVPMFAETSFGFEGEVPYDEIGINLWAIGTTMYLFSEYQMRRSNAGKTAAAE